MSKKSKKFVEIIFKIAVSFLLLYWVFKKIDIVEMYEELKKCSFPMFLLAGFINILVILMGAISFHCIYIKENVKQIFMVFFKSCFYTMILPGQLVGEGTKIFMLSSKKTKLEERVSAVFVDKMLNCIAMVIVGIVGINVSGLLVSARIKKILYLVFVIIIIVFLLLLNKRMLYKIEKVIEKIKIEKVRNFVIKYFQQWKMYSENRIGILKSLICGIIYQLMISLIYFILSVGIGIDVSFWDFCWINTFLTVVLLLPISIGGLGVRESTLVGMLALVGVESEKALLISILTFLIQVVRAIIAGVVILFDKRCERGSR